MTSTGLVIIPLAFLIILLHWRFSIIALLVLATLDSAAVVNAGSFGLQPGYFFGLLMIARTAVEITVFGTPLNAHVVRMLVPLLLFAIICFISIWVGLTFFQGKITVISSMAGFNLDLAQTYTFQRQNLTQPFYLFLNLGIVYALAHQIARLPADLVNVTLERAVLAAIVFASAVAVCEMAHFYAGAPFADSFFHSNAGYSKAHGQSLGRILRVSGTFSEPSALAYHFAAFLMYAWYRFLRQPGAGAIGLVLLCVTMMAASTSTSAFAVLGIFMLVVVKDLLVVIATSGTRIRLFPNGVAVVALLGSVAFGAYVFIQSNWHDIDSVLTSMLLQKHESSSYAQRTGADMMAVDIVVQTGGIGIGLGSHKPNNLAMTLLSNTGIAGFLVFGMFLFQLLWPYRTKSFDVDLRPYRWMVVGLLAVHLMSNPNLNPIILWISFALVIGALATERGSSSGLVDDRNASLVPAWRTTTAVGRLPPRSSAA
jgi:hypothetical protein